VGIAKFSQEDFFAAAVAIASTEGPAAVTIASITARLGAPTGSFYHRFASRNALLGELWLRTVLDFQEGISAALDANDGLGAALHTPAWVRAHLENARLLLLYDRRDFVAGGWPAELREQVAAMTQRMEAGSLRRARVIFGKDGREEVRLAQFLISEVPVAAVRQHLARNEPPPTLVERLIRTTYRAVVADYRARKRKPSLAEGRPR
jgi:AcrR family transcriptional regulator